MSIGRQSSGNLSITHLPQIAAMAGHACSQIDKTPRGQRDDHRDPIRCRRRGISPSSEHGVACSAVAEITQAVYENGQRNEKNWSQVHKNTSTEIKRINSIIQRWNGPNRDLFSFFIAFDAESNHKRKDVTESEYKKTVQKADPLVSGA